MGLEVSMPEEKNYIIDKLDAIEDRLEELDKPVKYKIETSDKQEHYMAFHGSDLYHTLRELREEIHDIVHHERAEGMGLDPETLDYVLNMIDEFMENNGVDFEHVS